MQYKINFFIAVSLVGLPGCFSIPVRGLFNFFVRRKDIAAYLPVVTFLRVSLKGHCRATQKIIIPDKIKKELSLPDQFGSTLLKNFLQLFGSCVGIQTGALTDLVDNRKRPARIVV